MLKKLLPILCALSVLSTACVTVPNVKGCTASDQLVNGAMCQESISGKESDMTLDEFIEFLEPNIQQKRAGAVCLSTKDYARMKKALDKACRELGSRCTHEVVESLRNLDRLHSRSLM